MKNNTRRGFIYFRYIFPVAAAVMMIILAFIPCYSYVTADTGINNAISLWELIGNSWSTVREYLFGSGQKADVTLDFARTLLCVIVALALLFIIGLASAVYAAICAFRYFARGCRDEKDTTLFITLVPNRIVLCIYHAFMLPVFFLPMLMPLLYGSILAYHVELNAYPFDIVFVALGIYLAVVCVIAVSADFELTEQKNIFTNRRVAEVEEDADEMSDGDGDESDDPYERMSQIEKAEQRERILRMLAKSSEEKEDGE